MNRNKFTLAWCVLAAFAASAAVAAGGSVRGTVADSNGAPLAKVTITLMGNGFDFEKKATTNKKGEFKLAVSDADREYLVRVEKEGYLTQEEPFEIPSGQAMSVDWTLHTMAEAAEQAEQIQALQAKDKATKAYNRAAEAYNAEDIEGAITGFREAIEANSGLAVAHAALGRIMLEKGRWAEARASAEAFLVVSPNEPLAWQTLYDAHWGEGNKEEAEKAMVKLLEFDSGSAVAARIFNQGVAATKTFDYDAAAAAFERAYSLDPSLYQALLPLAQIHSSKQEWQAAIDKAEQYLEHDKENPRANIVRYLSYQKLGDQEVAAQAFAELKSNSSVAAAQMFLRDGINLFNDGEIQGAIKSVETSVELDPSSPQAHHQLGLCYSSSGENAKARAAFERFLELAPEDPEAGTVREMLSYLK